jgi:hypothetical protein
VPKVYNKPIQSQKKGFKTKEQSIPKAALVWRTGLSGVPPDSVRCTRVDSLQLVSFGNSGGRSAIIHWIVRCSTGLSGVASDCPVCQRSNGYFAPTIVCNATVKHYSARLRAQKSEQAQKAHRTVNSDCPVHHRTVRWPTCQKLQRSNPNGLVTWLAYRTVSGAPYDRSLHQRSTWWLGL